MGVILLVMMLGATEVLTPPFLQNVGTDHISILCETDSRTPVEIEYGRDTDYGSVERAEVVRASLGSFRHLVRLAELSAGTTYHFRLVVAGVAEGEDRVFTTAPDVVRPFAFGVWGDSQGTNHGACAADPLAPTSALLDHMVDGGIDLAVTTGDLAELGLLYGPVRDFYLDRVAEHVGTRVPYFIAWGNHDTVRGNIIRRFADLPSGERPGFDPGWGSYSFDYAGCHFVCIDDDTRAWDILNWLESDLESDANRDAKFTFLFLHRPPYCERWVDGDRFLREKLVPLMEAYGVDVCFSGHTHEYERGYTNGIYYCVTGGGSWLDFGEPIIYNWPHMTVGGAQDLPGFTGGLVNEYVRIEVGANSWKATMHAFDPCGEYLGVMDEFGSETPPDNIAAGPEPPQCGTVAPAKRGERRTAQVLPDTGILGVMLAVLWGVGRRSRAR